MSDLSFGMQGPEVGNLQRFFNSIGLKDSKGYPLAVDEDFGRETKFATMQFQVEAGIPDKIGVFGFVSRKHAQAQGFIPFVPARKFTMVPAGPGSNPRKIDRIVIHTMEAPDKPETAENVAAWFAGSNAPKASAHYCVDNNSVVQCVRDRDVAWHAPGANHNGIGIEHAGYARQTAEEWKSNYNKQMLVRSSQLAARLCREYNIPVQRLTAYDLKAGLRGFCGHVDITQAFNEGHGHTDPGLHFPWNDYLLLVELAGDIS